MYRVTVELWVPRCLLDTAFSLRVVGGNVCINPTTPSTPLLSLLFFVRPTFDDAVPIVEDVVEAIKRIAEPFFCPYFASIISIQLPMIASGTSRILSMFLWLICGSRLPLLAEAWRTSSAFSLPSSRPSVARQLQLSLSSSTTSTTTENPTTRRPCFHKSPAHNNKWKPRLEMSQVYIGQELNATVVQELLDGRTGPKVFCEVGVGRYRPQFAWTTAEEEMLSIESETNEATQAQSSKPQRRDWQIVSAMLRLPRNEKPSVTRKRAARLRRQAYFPIYVSRIRPAQAALEVCLDMDHARQTAAADEAKRALSPLHVGQVVQGKVVRIHDFGVLVDISAYSRNRPHGLLHISTVADYFGRYIDKAAGLQACGLHRGARVQLQVAALRGKDIALGFVEEEKDKKTNSAAVNEAQSQPTVTTSASGAASSTTSLTKEEEEAWAAFAANPTKQETVVEDDTEEEADEEEDNDDDDYDEDREIEDAFGLGYY